MKILLSFFRGLKAKLWALSLKGKNPEDIFTAIYQKNKWQDGESVSGPGSTLDETAHLRPALEKLFKERAINTIIDVPCGDFNWFREMSYAFEHYIGYDIVEPLIEKNRENYGSDSYKFEKKDCLSEPLVAADLLFCRDLLLHLATADIFRFFQNFLRADIPLLLISHAIGVENKEIVTGQGRLVNLTDAPFNLPEPEVIIMENSAVFDGKYKDIRCMALWTKESIAEALAENTHFNALKKAA